MLKRMFVPCYCYYFVAMYMVSIGCVKTLSFGDILLPALLGGNF